MKQSSRESQHRAIAVIKLDSPEELDGLADGITDTDFRSLLEMAFTDSEIPWQACEVDITGSTAVALVQPQISKTRLINQLPTHLIKVLGEWNKTNFPAVSFKTRLALHAGEIYDNDTGLPNLPVDFTQQLAKLDELKTTLRKSKSPLGIITSDWFYHNVIGQDPDAAAEDYQCVQVDEANIIAWMRLSEEPLLKAHESIPNTEAWILMLERLAQQNPGAKQLVDLCACLDANPVPQNMLLELRDSSIPQQLEEVLHSSLTFHKAVNDIAQCGLGRIDARNNTLLLHHQVHKIALCRLSLPQQQRLRQIAHLALVRLDPMRPGTPQYWSLYRELAPHVQASRAVDSDNSLVRRIVINQAIFHIAAGDLQHGLVIAREAMELWTIKLGESHQDTLSAARRVALALRELGRYAEAKKIDERTWKILKDTVGSDDTETLVLAGLFSADLRAMGDFLSAQDVTRDTYQRAMRNEAEYPSYALYAAHNLAISNRLMGDSVAAMKLAHDAWQGRKKIFGEADRFTLVSLSHYASDLLETGKYTAGRMLHEEATVTHRSYLSDEHPQTLSSIRDLAIARRKTGDFQGSFALAQEAWQGFSKFFHEAHPDAIAALLVLSVEHRYAGDLAGAHELGDKAWRLYQKSLGENHPFALMSATNVAIALRLLGNAEKAQQVNQDVLHELQSQLGSGHPFTLSCSVNLASDLAALGDKNSALAMTSDALNRIKINHPDRRALSISTQLNYAIDAKSLGRFDEAEQSHSEVMAKLHNDLGPNNPLTFSAGQWIRANCDFDPMPLL